MNDPTSYVGAATHRMQHPLSREGFVLMDVWDLLRNAHHNGKGGKPKPYPRPTDKPPPRFGNTGGRTQRAIRKLLAMRGHGAD